MKAFYQLGLTAMLVACSSEPTGKNAASLEASQVDTAPDSTLENEDASDQVQASSADTQVNDESRWSVSTSTDPMNDAQIVKAVTNISGTRVDLQIEVQCTNNRSLSYRISSFDKNDKGVEMRDILGRPLGHAFMYRVDKAPERMEPWDNPQYTNQAGIITHAEDAASARTLLLRFQFANSSEIYSVDQSSPEFRSAVAGCLSSESNAATDVNSGEKDGEAITNASSEPPAL